MSDYAELVGRLEGAYSTVFERSLAKQAADAIKALVQERDQQSAGVLVLAAQLAQAKERAERAELEAAFRKKTCAVEIQRAEKAESALAECMAHADAMAARAEAYEMWVLGWPSAQFPVDYGPQPWRKFRAWKEGQHE